MAQIGQTVREVIERQGKIQIEHCRFVCSQLLTFNCFLDCCQRILLMAQIQQTIRKVIEGPGEIQIQSCRLAYSKLSMQLDRFIDQILCKCCL